MLSSPSRLEQPQHSFVHRSILARHVDGPAHTSCLRGKDDSYGDRVAAREGSVTRPAPPAGAPGTWQREYVRRLVRLHGIDADEVVVVDLELDSSLGVHEIL